MIYEYYSPPMHYDQIVATQGEMLGNWTLGDWQGDYVYLLKNEDRYAFTVIGYGSCSGCDALEACESDEEFNELKEEITTLNITNCELKEENYNLETTISELKEEIITLESSINELNEENASLENTISELREDNYNFETTISELRDEINSIEDNKILLEKINRINNNIIEKTLENNKLKLQLEDITDLYTLALTKIEKLTK